MATLQKRICRGHTYWSIVESRRINGKPRPVILEYLGSAENLIQRLQEGVPEKVQSYSHGAVSLLLQIAEELDVIEIINRFIPSKQLRDGLTVGGSLVLASLGRACHPTSKMNWYHGWAKHTSLSYLVGRSFHKLDSQHFWDQMDALPVEAISSIEEALLKVVFEKEQIALDTILLDMTNFFTYIASTNKKCNLAQRGKNKQKRMDLKQFGLLLLVTRKDQIPIFHKIYQGNLVDRTIFKEQYQHILQRFKTLAGSLKDITLVFDQGNNSKQVLKNVHQRLCFVGALSPYHHKQLVATANKSLSLVSIKGKDVPCYRKRMTVWQLDLTVIVYISEKLRQGQIRGIEQNIHKLFVKLQTIKDKLQTPNMRGRKRTKEKLESTIRKMVTASLPTGLIGWSLVALDENHFSLDYWIEQDQYHALKENWLGRRILITNRHEWTAEEIILAYWGQNKVERVFRMIKNPFYLPLRPQYHWTDQKIQVHGLICFIALLMSMILHKRAKEQAGFNQSFFTLMEKLCSIRLATFIEKNPEQKKGRYKTSYVLEKIDHTIENLAKNMGVENKKFKINKAFSVYN